MKNNIQMIDLYLDYIQESDNEHLQEIAPLVGVSIYIVMSFVLILIQFFMFMKIAASGKEDPKLSKDLNEVIKKAGFETFKVVILDSKDLNAFALFNSTIYITKGLYKVLNQRQRIAVMIHEVSHVINKHVIKQTIMSNTFGAILFGGVLTALTGPYVILAPYTAGFCISISATLKNRIMGRKHELTADSLASKFGYGEELAEVLTILDAHEKKIFGEGKLSEIILKLVHMVDAHPPLKERLENITKTKEIYKLFSPSYNIAKVKSFLINAFKVNPAK